MCIPMHRGNFHGTLYSAVQCVTSTWIISLKSRGVFFRNTRYHIVCVFRHSLLKTLIILYINTWYSNHSVLMYYWILLRKINGLLLLKKRYYAMRANPRPTKKTFEYRLAFFLLFFNVFINLAFQFSSAQHGIPELGKAHISRVS